MSTFLQWVLIAFFVGAVVSGTSQIMKRVIPDPAFTVIVCHYHNNGENTLPICERADDLLKEINS